jgi:hypothetical protein
MCWATTGGNDCANKSDWALLNYRLDYATDAERFVNQRE